jgi:hypothetical protein
MQNNGKVCYMCYVFAVLYELIGSSSDKFYKIKLIAMESQCVSLKPVLKVFFKYTFSNNKILKHYMAWAREK